MASAFGRKHYHLGIMLVVTAVFCFLFRPGQVLLADGYNYLSAAESLVHQGRFLMADGTDFSLWPPLFPILLTPVYLFGFSPELWTALLGAGAIAAVYWYTFRLLSLLTERRTSSLLIASALLFFPALVRTGQTVVVDILHLGLVMAGWYIFFLFQRDQRILRPLLLIAALLPLLRYIGLLFVLIWAAWCWYNHRRRSATALIVASLIGIIAWEIRNAGLDNIVFDRSLHWWAAGPDAIERLWASVGTSILYVFIPNRGFNFALVVAIVGGLGIALVRYYARRRPAFFPQARLMTIAAAAYFIVLTAIQFFSDPTLRYDIRLVLPASYLLAVVAGLAAVQTRITTRFIPRAIGIILVAGVLVPQILAVALVHHRRVEHEQAWQNEIEALATKHPNIAATNGFGWYWYVTGRRVPRIPPPTIDGHRDLWVDKPAVFTQVVKTICTTGGEILLRDLDSPFTKMQLADLGRSFTITARETRGIFVVYRATPRPGVCQEI